MKLHFFQNHHSEKKTHNNFIFNPIIKINQKLTYREKIMYKDWETLRKEQERKTRAMNKPK